MARPENRIVSHLFSSIPWLLLCTCLAPSLAWAVKGIDDAKFAIRTRDYDTAVAILSRLSSNGDNESTYLLASLYRLGRGVGEGEGQ